MDMDMDNYNLIQYNLDILTKFRKIAVTKVEDLVVGKMFWSSETGSSFIMKGLLTANEFSARLRRDELPADPSGPLEFYETEAGDMGSLTDHNIGDSYNPWLIFDNEAAMLGYLSLIDIH